MELLDYPISTVAPQDGYCHPKLNRALGSGDRLHAFGDRFRAGDRDVPLWGVNMGVYLTDEGAFGFLSSLGINLVRINSPFRTWTKEGEVGIPVRTPIDPTPRDLDALFKMQSLCEKYGIYVLITDFNMGIGRDVLSQSDQQKFWTFSPDASSLGIWHPGIREIIATRIARLLGAQNPYTRRKFGESPALFGIQPVNEVMWFGSDLQTREPKLWSRLQTASSGVKRAMGNLAAVSQVERVRVIARATREAYDAIKGSLESVGPNRPLLIADMSTYAGPAAFEAFAPCDAYALNIYPDIGDHSDVSGPIRPSDLRPDLELDRLQVRIGGKPTIITEVGEKLAPGGSARLIAEMAVRAGVGGYAGIVFHHMFRGIYGEFSGNREHLASRAPLMNFELSTDPAAQCALQACSIIHRNRLVRGGEKRIVIERKSEDWLAVAANSGRQFHELHGIASALSSATKRELGKPETAIVLAIAGGSSEKVEENRSAGTIQIGHVRVGFVEIDWHTDRRPENDWLFIRVPIESRRRLIVLVGRSKPDPADQRFAGGHATLSGLVRYPWPDPRTGYGTRQLVRRPEGPEITISGALFSVRADGKRGSRANLSRNPGALPMTTIRFMEEMTMAMVLQEL